MKILWSCSISFSYRSHHCYDSQEDPNPR